MLFFERKESTRRALWLMILLFLPVIGMIFYILFSGHFFTGTKRMNQTNQTAIKLFKPLITDQKNYLDENREILPNHAVQDFLPLIEMNLSKADSLLLFTDTIKTYRFGNEFFPELCQSLRNARKSIFMEYFIFKEDKTGTQIMDILCEKAKEGVEVKLLYDDLGSLFTRTKFFDRLIKSGGEAKPFYQIRIGLPLSLNYRNHRKVTIIDNETAFTGGMNIGDEYANQSKRIKLNWRDTVIRLTGTTVLGLQTNFFIDWYSIVAWDKRKNSNRQLAAHYPPSIIQDITNATRKEQKQEIFSKWFTKDRIPTQIIVAGPDDAHKAEIEDTLIRMIMNAKKSVYIQTPYFTPDEQFFYALKLAAFNGVDVRVMIPRDWDKFYMKAASSEFARQIIEDEVKIYLYPGFIHSKTIAVDGKICSIGTTNIDTRSFKLHFEQNLIFYDENFTTQCEKIFFEDAEISTPVDKHYYDSFPVAKRAMWSFFKLFSPFM